MGEKSLKITGADKTFLSKLSKTINKILIPTKVGINGMLISVKRNNLIKAFENFENKSELTISFHSIESKSSCDYKKKH